MKTLIWKELREHVRWIPFCLLPMLYVIYQSVSANVVFDESKQFPSAVAMVSSIFACLLGILQSWPDNRPAARALLLHRSVTAESAFSAKLVAAAIVYSTAILLPLLGLATWIAINSRQTIAAYAIDVLPAALAAIFCFVAWPSAFLVVHRKASFFGSRLFPVATAVFVTFICTTPSSITSNSGMIFFALSLILTAILLLLAARAVFIRGEEPIGFLRVAMWLVNASCLLVAFILVTASVLTAMQPDPGPDRYRNRAVVLGPEGGAWLQSTNSWDLKSIEVAKLISQESARSKLQPAAPDWKPLQSWNTMGGSQVQSSLSPGFPVVGTLVLNAPVQRVWLFDARSQEVLTYDVSLSLKKHVERLARLRVGNEDLGSLAAGTWQNGYASNQGSVSTGAVKPGAIFPTEKGLFHLPIDGQSITQIYKASETRPVISAQFGSKAGDATMNVALRLADRIVLIWNGNVVAPTANTIELGEFGNYGLVHALEIPLPAEIEALESVRVALHPTTSGEFVGVTSKFDQITWDQSQRWYRFDAAGKVLEEQAYNELLFYMVQVGDISLAAVIPPGLFGVVMCFDSLVGEPPTLLPSIIVAIRKTPLEALSFALLLAVQSFIAVLLAVWAVRRRNVSQAIRKRWYIVAALFGPMAAFGILTVYPKIAMERCGSCHALTPVTSSKCQHCHESLDEATRTGIEVFDHDKVSVDSRMAAAL
jgi:hypothetical protein